MIKPTIMIKSYKSVDANEHRLAEILAGIEEEGVLYDIDWQVDSLQTDEKDDYAEASRLAKEAAESSQLEVGIGLYNQVAILTVHKLGGIPLLDTCTMYRWIGQNAARYVKGMSFRG